MLDPKGNLSRIAIPTHFPVSDGPDEDRWTEIPSFNRLLTDAVMSNCLPSPMEPPWMQVDELITVGCLLQIPPFILLSIVTQDDSCEGS